MCQYSRGLWIELRPARKTRIYKKLGKRMIKKMAGVKLYPSQINEEKILGTLVIICGYKREDIIRVLGVQLR